MRNLDRYTKTLPFDRFRRQSGLEVALLRARQRAGCSRYSWSGTSYSAAWPRSPVTARLRLRARTDTSHEDIMYLSLFLRDGIVYIPTLARTDAGFHVTVEPVVT